MESCQEYAFTYARALGEHGADMLSGGDAPAGLIGPRLYEKLALPQEQSLITRLKSVSRKPVSLHICGQTTPILPLMSKAGADVLELDYPVDLAKARQLITAETAIWGNLDPVGVLAQGTPKAVRCAARQAIAAMKDNSRFVLSSGCTLAVETPAENVRAMLAPLPPDLFQ
jgi:uroporphyrinogen-III decarboxylase